MFSPPKSQLLKESVKGVETIKGIGFFKELVKIHIRFRARYSKWDGGVQKKGFSPGSH